MAVDPRLAEKARKVNDILADRAIRHAIYIQRLSNTEIRKLIKLLIASDDQLTEKIRARLERLGPLSKQEYGKGRFTTERAIALRDEIRAIVRDSRDLLNGTLQPALRDLAATEGNFQLGVIRNSIPIEWSLTSPGSRTLEAVVTVQPMKGKHLRAWVSEWSARKAASVDSRIKVGIINGESIDQIVTGLRGKSSLNFADGVLSVSRRSAEALARTAVNHVVSRAREEIYRENEDVVKEVRWVSTLDDRTSALCQSLDGKVFPVGEGPRPPAHPNCRSTTAPVLKSWKELGIEADEIDGETRASMNGQVPQDITYGAWLKDQPAEFQDDVLGRTKGALFRDGGLSVDKFVDIKSGKEFTLDELRRREADAFKRAGV